jgi:hypothetical protein
VNRWYAAINPQHSLRGAAVSVLGTSRFMDEQSTKPALREAPPSA